MMIGLNRTAKIIVKIAFNDSPLILLKFFFRCLRHFNFFDCQQKSQTLRLWMKAHFESVNDYY